MTTLASSRRSTGALRKLPDYRTLFKEVDLTRAAEEVHNGYFSIDKKGGWTDTAENNQANRDNAERAYNLIMKDKEKLLGFETPLKFIFSHSALSEGWDNPNVFQICTLRDIRTERERRQTIGRGLRLCVNQQGRTHSRLRDQHAHRGRYGELRTVRREPSEGDRGGYRHPLRHRRTAPVRCDRGYRSRRKNCHRSASSSRKRSGSISSTPVTSTPRARCRTPSSRR